MESAFIFPAIAEKPDIILLTGDIYDERKGSFESPLDYYYHAEALRLLAPREDVLMDGTLDGSFSGSNKNLRYTRRDLGKTSLILIGNYEAVKGAESVLKLPGARSVTELRSGKKLSLHNGKVTVIVPADEYIRLEVRF